MSRIAKLFIFLMLAGLSPFASAQCVPAPIIMGGGYQGGSPCWGGAPQQQQGGGIIGVIGVLIQKEVARQEYVLAVKRQLPPNCTLVERDIWSKLETGAGSVLVEALAGALSGAAVDRLSGTGSRFTEASAEYAASRGLSRLLQQQYVLACRQPEARREAGSGGAVCILPTRDVTGLTEQQCNSIGGVIKGADGQANHVPAGDGCSFKRHPNDTNLSWRKIDWPGHPQHGLCAWLPPEEEVQRQKAAMGK